MLSPELLTTIKNEAIANNLEPAALQAIVSVESSGTPFWNIDGEDKPIARFEGHYFYARLKGDKLNRAVKEGLASKQAGGVANPTSGAARYALIAKAALIDHDAAYESVSWGLGQVMGANWSSLGYRSVDELVTDASSVAGQIDQMIKYLQVNGLVSAMQKRDWKAVAKGYNGANYAAGGYDKKLASAYNSFANAPTSTGPVSTDENIQMQTMLNAVGDYKLVLDGVIGIGTKVALKDFQLKNGLVDDGLYGPLTKEKLTAVYVAKFKHGQGMFGAGASTLGAAGTAASEAAKQIQGFAASSQVVQIVFIALTVIGIAFTAWSFFRKQA